MIEFFQTLRLIQREPATQNIGRINEFYNYTWGMHPVNQPYMDTPTYGNIGYVNKTALSMPKPDYEYSEGIDINDLVSFCQSINSNFACITACHNDGFLQWNSNVKFNGGDSIPYNDITRGGITIPQYYPFDIGISGIGTITRDLLGEFVNACIIANIEPALYVNIGRSLNWRGGVLTTENAAEGARSEDAKLYEPFTQFMIDIITELYQIYGIKLFWLDQGRWFPLTHRQRFYTELRRLNRDMLLMINTHPENDTFREDETWIPWPIDVVTWENLPVYSGIDTGELSAWQIRNGKTYFIPKLPITPSYVGDKYGWLPEGVTAKSTAVLQAEYDYFKTYNAIPYFSIGIDPATGLITGGLKTSLNGIVL